MYMIVYTYTYAHVDDFISHAHNVLVYVYTTSTLPKIEGGSARITCAAEEEFVEFR